MLQDQIRQFINELSMVLSTIERKNNDVLLAGDFNINLLKLNENQICSEFFDSLLAHSFLPQITVPTRFGQFSHTLIDNFFLKSNNLAHKTIAGVFLKKLSDHQPYFVLINIKLTKERTSKYIQINIQTDVAMEKVKNELIECDLYGKLDTCISADINANYDILHNAIKQAKNKHMPCKFIKFNKYKHTKSKWITQGLLKSIRSRDKLYARLKRLQPNTIEHNTLLINLKTYNNILKRSIRTAKTLYFEITFQKFKYE